MAFTSNDIDRLTGASVRGSGNDKIGSIGQVYVDQDGAPVWATVRTGLFGTSESFIPLDRADFDGDDVNVPFDKDTVKGAPRVDVDGELNDEETDHLYDYYDGHLSGGSSTTGTGAYDDRTAGVDTTTTGVDTTTTGVDTTTTGVDTVGAGAAGYDTTTRGTTDRPQVGRDTSGPSTDDAMTRSEERLHVGTRQVETGRARLRKHIVTEQQTVTVPVTHEEATIVREPITDANIGDATSGADLSEEEHEVVLHGEQVVTSKDTVAVERIRLDTQTVTENQQVTEDVRKEEIDYVDPDGTTGSGTTRR